VFSRYFEIPFLPLSPTVYISTKPLKSFYTVRSKTVRVSV
jgi:hypothetical protein